MAKEEKKYCPLAYAVGKGAYDQEISNFDYCTKEKCAWWDILAGDCAITVIAKLGLEGSFNAITKEIKR